jgi:homoaconitase/3-isopropylmalate dehydratase large subunit
MSDAVYADNIVNMMLKNTSPKVALPHLPENVVPMSDEAEEY